MLRAGPARCNGKMPVSPAILSPFLSRRSLMMIPAFNPWSLLGLCIALEVTATTLLTKSEGFARPLYGVASMLLFGGCFWVLAQVLTRIPVGVAYAIWSGAGIAAISVIGWLFLKQALSPVQMSFIALIVIGAVGLNLTTHAG
jgi:small multidrug resistance pump